MMDWTMRYLTLTGIALAVAVALVLGERAIHGSASRWSVADIADSSRDKTYLVTGGNIGLGFETVRILLATGGKVIFTVRSDEKGKETIRELSRHRLGKVENARVELVDLSDLESVHNLTARLLERGEKIDVVVLNAGVYGMPEQLSPQGFEMHFATNHLGHFYMMQRIAPLVKERVVVVSSFVAELYSTPPFDFATIANPPNYDARIAYANSKLMNLMFAVGLQKRNRDFIVVASHPGYSATALHRRSIFQVLILNSLFAMDARVGALAQVRAAVEPEAKPLEYFVPCGSFEIYGHPHVRKFLPSYATNLTAVDLLWNVSEALITDWKVTTGRNNETGEAGETQQEVETESNTTPTVQQTVVEAAAAMGTQGNKE